MCRLLAYASPHDHAIADLLSEDELAEFSALSKLHGDGWGMAWVPGNDRGFEAQLGSTRSASRAIDDPLYQVFAASPMGRAGLAHIRWATPGYAVTEQNSHPFTIGPWAFAHNGNIEHSERIEALLSHRSKALLEHDTDSKRYFLLVLQRIEELGDPIAGVRRALADIPELCELGTLNAVLLSDELLVAIQAQGATPAPIEWLAKSAGGAERLPAGHDESYYKLRFSQRGSSLVISSTGITSGRWSTLDEDSIIVVDLRTNTVEILPLASTSPAAVFPLSRT
jgi:predicted glutamine amidotransferase